MVGLAPEKILSFSETDKSFGDDLRFRFMDFGVADRDNRRVITNIKGENSKDGLFV